MKKQLVAYSLLASSAAVFAETSANDAVTKSRWVDTQHANVKSTLHSWSNSIDDWFGTPDPNQPASANLRIMLDNQWNRYDGYSVKPRVRGKIRLPTLKRHLNVVFGDEDLDNLAQEKHQTAPNYREPLDKGKRYDGRQARHDNSSLALRWSDGIKRWGVDTDLDLGVRSGTDLFLRFKAGKTWQHTERFSTRVETIYRYGLKSHHYARLGVDNKYRENDRVFINNHTYVQYTHKKGDEQVSWGNSLYREHAFAGNKRLSYGVAFNGSVEKRKVYLNQYGPFINWRQPLWREWLFVQPELSYSNNRKLDRPHHLQGFMRLEVIF